MLLDHISLIILVIACILFYFIGRRSIRVLPPSYNSKNLILVDTSALIDGRILEVANTGFISGKMIIMSYILSELQNIADSSDQLRRGKGRRGLKILKELQKVPFFEVEIIQEEIDDVSKIDKKLVEKAKEMNAKILTTDYNLNEVAKIQDVSILNINELSNAIKPVLLPGEETEVKVVQKGKEKGQGVGYLEDGTMIVVEEGERFLGRRVRAEVSRIFQTDAGRMIFVKLKEPEKKSFFGTMKTPKFPHIFHKDSNNNNNNINNNYQKNNHYKK